MTLYGQAPETVMSAAAAAIEFYANQLKVKSELRQDKNCPLSSYLKRIQNYILIASCLNNFIIWKIMSRESHLVGRISQMKAQCNKKLEDLYSAYTTVTDLLNPLHTMACVSMFTVLILNKSALFPVQKEASGSSSREGWAWTGDKGATGEI